MRIEGFDGPAAEDPLAQLERAFIEEFLQRHGQSLSTVHQLPHEETMKLLKEASLYASGRLTEVESRAHYVSDMHDGARAMPNLIPKSNGGS